MKRFLQAFVGLAFLCSVGLAVNAVAGNLPDSRSAFKALVEQARKGDVSSQLRVGMAYSSLLKGSAVSHDATSDIVAAAWLEMAALHGNDIAAGAWGLHKMQGLGCQKDEAAGKKLIWRGLWGGMPSDPAEQVVYEELLKAKDRFHI